MSVILFHGSIVKSFSYVFSHPRVLSLQIRSRAEDCIKDLTLRENYWIHRYLKTHKHKIMIRSKEERTLQQKESIELVYLQVSIKIIHMNSLIWFYRRNPCIVYFWCWILWSRLDYAVSAGKTKKWAINSIHYRQITCEFLEGENVLTMCLAVEFHEITCNSINLHGKFSCRGNHNCSSPISRHELCMVQKLHTRYQKCQCLSRA